MHPYRTLYEQAETVIIEKKSRFIGTAIPVASQAEAEALVKHYQKTVYKDATHNCFAYRVREGTQLIERQSDNGEPAGTAGMPILAVLRGEALLNVLVIVTRYYGGTLLGTGGLNRAYGGTAKAAIRPDNIIDQNIYHHYQVNMPYDKHGSVAYELGLTEAVVTDTIYTDQVQVMLSVIETSAPALLTSLTQWLQGSAGVQLVSQGYGFIYQGQFVEA